MGTWGVGPFENDTAVDLVDALRRGTFSMKQFRFECSEGPLSATEAEMVIALAALIAGERPVTRAIPPQALDFAPSEKRWVQRQVRSVTQPGTSDIYALWEDTGEVDAWLKECDRIVP